MQLLLSKASLLFQQSEISLLAQR